MADVSKDCKVPYFSEKNVPIWMKFWQQKTT